MVKGITRQVVVVKGPDPKLFEQAIFLVREDALTDGGISEETLLKQARQACAEKEAGLRAWLPKLLWAAAGACAMGLIWLLSAIL